MIFLQRLSGKGHPLHGAVGQQQVVGVDTDALALFFPLCHGRTHTRVA
jgi:hypothetical protein